jgi:hypothetical protein
MTGRASRFCTSTSKAFDLVTESKGDGAIMNNRKHRFIYRPQKLSVMRAGC